MSGKNPIANQFEVKMLTSNELWSKIQKQKEILKQKNPEAEKNLKTKNSKATKNPKIKRKNRSEECRGEKISSGVNSEKKLKVKMIPKCVKKKFQGLEV